MANHIENYITIRHADENVLNEVKRIFKFEAENKYDEIHTEDLVKAIYGSDAPAEYDRQWYVENTGAKWVHGFVDVWDVEEIIIIMTSAWDPVNSLLDRLAKNLIEIKEDVVVENKFEDEGLNFIGVAYFSKEYTDEEYYDDEIDAERFYEDDDYRYDIYDNVELMMDDMRRIHSEVIEDNKNEAYEK